MTIQPPLEYKISKDVFKVIFVGESGVGVTSVIKKYIQGSFIEGYKCTTGIEFFSKNIHIADRHLTLSIWDFDGSDRWLFFQPTLYKGASIAVIVLDVTRRKSFVRATTYIERLWEILGTEIPIILVANKTDLYDSRRFSSQEALDYANKINFDYFEVSAKNGDNINKLFKRIVELLIQPPKREPVELEPSKLEPVELEPSKLEPVELEPSKLEPVELELSKLEPVELKLVTYTKQLDRKVQRKLLIFISYASQDLNSFRIPEISQRLKKYSEILDALYWEEDAEDDIYRYMDENLKRCDVLILFCSPNALKSSPIFLEYTVALKLKKSIIPVFIDERDIPTLLTTTVGLQFDFNNFDAAMEGLYQLILKKTRYQKEIKQEFH